jgi:hypothetical protein
MTAMSWQQTMSAHRALTERFISERLCTECYVSVHGSTDEAEARRMSRPAVMEAIAWGYGRFAQCAECYVDHVSQHEAYDRVEWYRVADRERLEGSLENRAPLWVALGAGRRYRSVGFEGDGRLRTGAEIVAEWPEAMRDAEAAIRTIDGHTYVTCDGEAWKEAGG